MSAELALAMPAVMLVAGLCLNGLTAGAVRVSLAEAAFAEARLASRGEAVGHRGETPFRGGGLVCLEKGRQVGLFWVSERACVADETVSR